MVKYHVTLLMKAVRPKETVPGLKAVDLIRYAMSVEGADAVVVGMDSMETVKSNLELLRNFQPATAEEMQKMAQTLTPLYNHRNFDWMQPGYCDGHWKSS